MTYVQLLRKIDNGHTDKGPAAVLLAPNEDRYWLIKEGLKTPDGRPVDFPLLDTAPPGTNPAYALTRAQLNPADPMAVVVTMEDSPTFRFASPEENAKIFKLDYDMQFETFLDVRF